MTIEDAIKWLNFEKNCILGDCDCGKDLIEAYNMAIKALKQQMQCWIPANKMLPRENIVVVGTTEYCDIYLTTLYNFHGVYKWYSNDNLECNLPIVAWIPLPENYTEGGD